MIVKVCGITQADDAAMALRAGADWIGLNLVAGPRRIEPSAACRLLSTLNDPSAAAALVDCVQNPPGSALLLELAAAGLRRIQVYGAIKPDVPARLAASGFETILACRVSGPDSLDRLAAFLTSAVDAPPHYLLFDAGVSGKLGGTGHVADWGLIAEFLDAHRDSGLPPVLLAGGLTPDNVAEAIRAIRPAGVDVSSGVETEPGRKDSKRTEAFVAAVRGACGP